mmetsp:Transcript_26391/g.86726  ORF Transcript_26391/g.86726 Transcript_26391/m.86726 type:complete len:619 (+) Transcript_26391:266-2122(+)
MSLDEPLELLLARLGVNSLLLHDLSVESLLHTPILLLQKVREPSCHPCRHIASRLTQNYHDTSSHVLQRMIARPLADSMTTRVPHGKSLARLAVGEQTPTCGPVQSRVPDDHVLLGQELGLRWGSDDNVTAMDALAHVVVDLTHNLHRHAWQREGAEALTGRALEHEVKVPSLPLVPQVPPPLGDLTCDTSARGPIGVDDLELLLELLRPIDRSHHLLVSQDLVVQHRTVVVDALRPLVVYPRPIVLGIGRAEQEAEVEVLGLGRRCLLALRQQVGASNEVGETLVAEVSHHLPHLLRDELKVVHDSLGGPREFLPQRLLLRRDAHRAVVGVADASHDATLGDHGDRSETVLLRSHQSSEHNVPSCLHPSVHSQQHAIAQAVLVKSLVYLCQPQLPWQPRVLDGREWRRAGAAVVPGDVDDVSIRLRHSRRDGADARAGDELNADLGLGVDHVQVVDQLSKILDGVDVVVGGRRDQSHSGLGQPQRRDVLVDLVARQLPALTRLRSLRDLDLDLRRRHQVLGSHPEPPGRDLLDLRRDLVPVLEATQVRKAGRVTGLVHVGDGLEAKLVLSSFARVRLAADAVHRHRESLMGLARESSQRHAARVKLAHDLLHGLDLI